MADPARLGCDRVLAQPRRHDLVALRPHREPDGDRVPRPAGRPPRPGPVHPRGAAARGGPVPGVPAPAGAPAVPGRAPALGRGGLVPDRGPPARGAAARRLRRRRRAAPRRPVPGGRPGPRPLPLGDPPDRGAPAGHDALRAAPPRPGRRHRVDPGAALDHRRRPGRRARRPSRRGAARGDATTCSTRRPRPRPCPGGERRAYSRGPRQAAAQPDADDPAVRAGDPGQGRRLVRPDPVGAGSPWCCYDFRPGGARPPHGSPRPSAG